MENNQNNEYIEVLSERKEHVKVYQGNEGRRKMVISDAPLHVFEQQTGTYADVDISLKDEGDCFTNGKAAYKTRFKKHTQNGKLMEMEKDGYKVSLDIAPGCNCGEGCICLRSDKPSELVYHNVFPNTDISYEAMPNRIKESIIIKERSGSYEYTFMLKAEGLTAELISGKKAISLKNNEGKEIFRIPAPFMCDGARSISRNVSYSLNGEILTVTADAAWINDPTRVFPVTIDPTITVSSNSYVELATFDAHQYQWLDNELWLGGYYYLNYLLCGTVNISGLLSSYGISINNVVKCNYSFYGEPYGYMEYTLYGGNPEKSGIAYIDYCARDASGKYTVPLMSVYNATGSMNFFMEAGYDMEDYNISSNGTLEIEYTPDLDRISATSPTKTAYIAGDYFNPAGMTITAHYVGGTSGVIYSGYSYEPTGPLAAHHTQVIISYRGKTATVPITVFALTNIAVTTPPVKTSYIEGEYFDRTGMIVKAIYSNGTEKTIDSYTFSPTGALATGNTQITVSYQGKTATVPITVNAVVSEPAQIAESFKRDDSKSGQAGLNYNCATGAAAISLQDGRILYENTIISSPDLTISCVFNNRLNNRLPISLCGNINGTNYLAGGTPKGWKLNLQQMLFPKSASGGSYGNETQYVYIDALGVEHEFINDEKNSSRLIDKNKLGFVIEKNNTTVVKDANKTEYHFTDYILTRIKSLHNKEIKINYGSGKIQNIQLLTNNILREIFTFTHDGMGMLKTINAAAGATSFVYDDGLYYRWLKKVAYSGGSETSFAYENVSTAGAVPYLTAITDPSGYKLIFSYDNASPRKAMSFADGTVFTSITGTAAATGSMSSGSRSETIMYVANGAIVKDNVKNIQTRYLLDEEGRAYAVYEDSQTQSVTMKTLPQGEISYNGSQVSARVPNTPTNILSWFSWQFYEDDNYVASPNSNVYAAETNYTAGPESYVIYGDTNKYRWIKKTPNLGSFYDGRYILSGFCMARGSSGHSESEKNIFGLRVELTYKNGEKEFFFTPFTRKIKGWQFGAVAFDADKSILQEIAVYAYYSGNADSVVFSNMRLVRGSGDIKECHFFNSADPDCLLFSAKDIYAVFGYGFYGGYPQQVNVDYDTKISYPDFVFYDFTTENLLRAMKDPSDVTFYDYDGKLVTMPNHTITYFGVKIGGSYETVLLSSVTVASVINAGNGTKIISCKTENSSGSEVKQYVIYPDEQQAFINRSQYDSGNRLILTEDCRGVITDYAYDGFGNLLKTTTYNKSAPAEKIVQENRYDASGRRLSAEVDARRHEAGTEIKTSYSYTAKGFLDTATMPNSQVIKCDYTEANDLKSISSTVTVNSVNQINANGFGYNKEMVTSVSHNGFDYGFEYDGWGNIKKVTAAGNTLLTKSFTYSGAADTESVTYANGDTVKKEYDKYGRFTKQYLNGDPAAKIENIYSDHGSYLNPIENGSAKLRRHVDNYSGNIYNIADDGGDISSVFVNGYTADTTAMTIGYYKDSRKRHCETKYSLYGPTTLNYKYHYEDSKPDNRFWKTELTGKFESSHGYDSLGRTRRNVFSSTGDGLTIGADYYYKDAVDGSGQKTGTTGYVRQVVHKVNNGASEYELYDYDRNGNITGYCQIAGDWERNVTYEYDKLNRLTGEYTVVWLGNEYTYFATTWRYNAGGNISSKSIYNEATGYWHGASYLYGNTNWCDQLTSYKGQAITYDAAGNPKNYMGTALTWTRGRMLDTYTKGGTSCSYVYNASGLRVKKTVNGVEHKYWLEGSRILKETDGSNTLVYYHDATGICGMNYNGTDYYFRKNLFGDVTHIYRSWGTLVGSYTYDAWGCCTIGTNVGNIASINPFRYRGYYWDDEIGMYYLNSRYYDPEVGRFISPDSVNYLDEYEINGLNLYAYCLNNPVNYCDPSGHAAEWFMVLLDAFFVALGIGIGIGALAYTGYLIVDGLINHSGVEWGYIGDRVGTFISDAWHWATDWLFGSPSAVTTAPSPGGNFNSNNLGLTPGIESLIVSTALGLGLGNILFSKGKSRPGDLERGMNSRQRRMFQREIEKYKRENGMPPNYNLPWEILVALAEWVRQNFR